MLFTRQGPRPPPPPADTSPLDYSDQGPALIATCSVLVFLATLCVALRFWSRRLMQLRWMADDWLILAALIFHHVFTAAGLVEVVFGGLGRDVRLVLADNPNSLVILFKALLVAECAYGFSSPIVKLSILFFYDRIFPTRAIRIGCYIIGATSIGWMIAIQVVNFVQCRPLHAFWQLELQALPETECINLLLFFIGISVANSVIDLATVLLPIPTVFKLQTTTKKKIGIAAVFLLGGIAFAASLVRSVASGVIYREGNINFTKQNAIPGVVAAVEIYVGIIGACLPTMIPVYRKLRYGDVKGTNDRSNGVAQSYFKNSHAVTSKKLPKTGENAEGSSERLHENDWTAMSYEPHRPNAAHRWTAVETNRHSARSIPMHGIAVKSEVKWSENSGPNV